MNPMDTLRSTTVKVPTMSEFTPFVPRPPVPGPRSQSNIGWRTSPTPSPADDSSAVVALQRPTYPRTHTDKMVEMTAKDVADHTLYSALEHDAMTSKDTYRSTIVDCEALLAQFAASETDNGSKLETAVCCMVMCKIVRKCFHRFEGLTTRLLRVIFTGVFEEFPGIEWPLAEINFMALESYRDRHLSVMGEAAERESCAEHRINAVNNKGSAITTALRRWQYAWLYQIFRAWRGYAGNQKVRDEQFINYLRRIDHNRAKRVAFLMWTKFAVAHSRNKLMKESYNSHRRLMEQIDDYKLQSDTKDTELHRFRQTRDKQSKRLDSIEEGFAVEKQECAKARSQAAVLEDHVTIMKKTIHELIGKLEGPTRNRQCVLHPVVLAPKDATFTVVVVHWLNTVFNPHPPVKFLSRDMSNGDVFTAVFTSITGKKLSREIFDTPEEKVTAVMAALQQSDSTCPPHLFAGVTARAIVRGHELSILSLCVACMHHFVMAPHRFPLDTANNTLTQDTIAIRQHLDAIASHHERLTQWEALLSGLSHKLILRRHLEVSRPMEVIHSSNSVSNFLHRCLRHYPHHGTEDREAVTTHHEKLWRCVAHYCSLRPVAGTKTNAWAWTLVHVGWTAFCTDHNLVSTNSQLTKESLETLFVENSEGGNIVELEAFLKMISHVVEKREEPLAHFLEHGLCDVEMDFEGPVRARLSEPVQAAVVLTTHPSHALYRTLCTDTTYLTHTAFTKFCKEFRSKVEIPATFRAMHADPMEYLFLTLLHCQDRQEMSPVGLSLESFQSFLLLMALWTERGPWDTPLTKLGNFMKSM